MGPRFFREATEDLPENPKIARLPKITISRIAKHGNVQSTPKEGIGTISLVRLSTTTEG